MPPLTLCSWILGSAFVLVYSCMHVADSFRGPQTGPVQGSGIFPAPVQSCRGIETLHVVPFAANEVGFPFASTLPQAHM